MTVEPLVDRWYICKCGRPLYEHSSRTVPNRGGREYVCMSTESGRFEVWDGKHDYDPEYGLAVKR